MEIQSTPTIDHLSAIVKFDELSDSLSFLETISEEIIRGLNLTAIKKIDNKFEPVGRTIVYILSESHLAIHTWPEFNTMHIDLLSCSGTKLSDFDRVLKLVFKELKVVKYESKSHSI